jgi:Domain of unknown function (DUF1707)
MTGPGGDLIPGAGGRGRLRASHADREQVIITLKAAFVQGMLNKDEFDLRVAQTLASLTYADLAAVIDDIPPGLPTASGHRPSRAQGDQPVVRPGPALGAATAAYAAAWAFALNVSPDSSSTAPLIMLGGIVYVGVLLICVAAMVALRREKRSGGQPPRRPGPGAGGRSSQHFPSADQGRRLPPGQHGHTYTSQVALSMSARSMSGFRSSPHSCRLLSPSRSDTVCQARDIRGVGRCAPG